MANDLASLKQLIWRTTGSNDKRLPGDEIQGIVNDVISDISRMADISFDLVITEVPVFPGQKTLTDVRNSRAVYSVSVNGTALEFLTTDKFFEKYPEDTTGEPSHWTLWGDSMVVQPIPDDEGADRNVAAFTVEIRHQRAPQQVTDLQATRYLENAWDVIVPGVQTIACQNLIEDRRIPVFQATFRERLRRFLIMQSRLEHIATRLQSEEPG